MLSLLQSAVAFATSPPSEFHNVVELVAGLSVITGFVVGAVKLGRVLEAQSRSAIQVTEQHQQKLELLARLEAKIDVREMATTDRIQAWTARGSTWDARHERAEERLDDHAQQITGIRTRIHAITNETQKALGKQALHDQRITVLERERRAGPSDRRVT